MCMAGGTFFPPGTTQEQMDEYFKSLRLDNSTTASAPSSPSGRSGQTCQQQSSQRRKHSMSSVDNTLVERGNRYGRFEHNATMSQRIKALYRSSDNWQRLSQTQREAVDQIACKLSRIFSGDVDYTDNWHDIAGYAKLAEEDISERAARAKQLDLDLGAVQTVSFYPPL